MAWDDDEDDFGNELTPEENEELDRQMRAEEKLRRNHPMTKQAEEIYRVTTALVESITDEMEREMFGSTMLDSCMIIPAKLAGAIGSESWLLCMQNASIIRSHAEYILTGTSGLKYESNVDQRYVQMLRDEMLKFQALFVEWVKEIHQMEDEEYVDEWGLFLRKP
ncbi:hypothetical protein BH11BAC7_BH11BAC7_07580 [soil metagenome]